MSIQLIKTYAFYNYDLLDLSIIYFRVQIRAGTGGDEAGIWAGDLIKMYQRYCELNGWQFEIVSEDVAENESVKEIVIQVSNLLCTGSVKYIHIMYLNS